MPPQLYVPSYLNWFLKKADKLKTMYWHKCFLQYLESGGIKPKRWLLKSPVHLMRLSEIFKVYSDAKIIVTHRDPKKVVPSTASLISSVRSLYSDHEDPHRTGNEQSKVWSAYFNLFLYSREKLNKENRIIDIKFDDFVTDQMGTVKKIYNQFGWELSDTAKSNMDTFLKSNPKDKHGVHHYTLELFGLSEDSINKMFSPYIDFLNTL